MLHHADKLTDCDPRLLSLFLVVGKTVEATILEGARTLAAEQAAIAAGTSHLTNPADSLHVIVPGVRPLALAADVAPTPILWAERKRFDHFAGYVLAVADSLHISIRWGGMWKGRFLWNTPGMLDDLVHFELVA